MTEDHTVYDKIDGGEGQGFNPLVVFIVVAVIVIVIVAVLFNQREYKPVVAGVPAIEFELPDLDGNMVKLTEFRGKVVFLNIWATWCKPCEEEMPSMQKLYESLSDAPFEIVAVSIDSEKAAVVKEFVAKYKLTFTVLHDRPGKIKNTYKTTGVPETFIIDQNGVIAEKVWGPRDWSSPSSTVVIRDLIKNGPKTIAEYLGGEAPKAPAY